MKHLWIAIGLFTAVSCPGLATDEWLGLEQQQPVLIGIDLGQDEAQDQSLAVMLSLPLGESLGYYGYYNKTMLTDDDQEFESLALATTIWFQLSELAEIEMQYFFEGKQGELEKETFGIGLGLSQENWNFHVQFDNGETLIFTRDDVTDFLNTVVPERFANDVYGFGLAMGWQYDAWYWQASYQRYDYEHDLSQLGRSFFAQFIAKSSALAQSSLLISQSASLLLGHADFENDYSILISQDRSAIDQSYEETLVLSWQHWASQKLGYSFSASMPVPADSIGLTLGLRWVL